MKVEFIELEQGNLEHYQARHKWRCDESINYLFIPQFVPQKLENPTLGQLLDYYDDRDQFCSYMIYVDGNPVGDFSVDCDFRLLYKKVPSAWISITIGESKYQGRGIGKQAMEFIDDLIKSKGLYRIELGVFAFNTKAIAFYESLGYKRIGEIKGFTFYQGEYHSDYRYEKLLK